MNSILLTLIVAGIMLWLVNICIPMTGKIKQVLNVAVAVCVAVWLLSVFGVFSHANDLELPQLARATPMS